MQTPGDRFFKWAGLVLMSIMALGGAGWVVLVWRWIFKGMPCG